MNIMFSQESFILSLGDVHPPWADTPGRYPLDRHPPPPGRNPKRRADRSPFGRHPLETATSADGTHPTGKHSCSCHAIYLPPPHTPFHPAVSFCEIICSYVHEHLQVFSL